MYLFFSSQTQRKLYLNKSTTCQHFSKARGAQLVGVPFYARLECVRMRFYVGFNVLTYATPYKQCFIQTVAALPSDKAAEQEKETALWGMGGGGGMNEGWERRQWENKHEIFIFLEPLWFNKISKKMKKKIFWKSFRGMFVKIFLVQFQTWVSDSGLGSCLAQRYIASPFTQTLYVHLRGSKTAAGSVFLLVDFLWCYQLPTAVQSVSSV